MTRDAREERPSGLYPPVAPYDSGRLDVGDGHQLYWEACGDPKGRPVVFLHGGPGGGCSADHRRFFDPQRYNAILFDQRGCGRSRPHASLASNTTQHLIDDLEQIREARRLETWLIVGGSWGSALAIAYAERFPERVSGMVLRGVFTARASELRWLYTEGASCLFPEAWAAFTKLIPPSERSDLIAAYHARLNASSSTTRDEAARAWCAWEAATMTLRPRPEPPIDAFERDALLALARIETHYFVNKAFLAEGQLIGAAHKLVGVPGVIVQGRYDCVTPPMTAWDLHTAWPGSVLHIVPDAGHASIEPGILRRLIETLDEFAEAPSRLWTYA
jgi:proline iminopeptidase